MRKIDWEAPLSDEDIAWLRQAGIPGTEARIANHQSQFDADVPEDEVREDAVTQSALDPNSRGRGEPAVTGEGPVDVTPDLSGESDSEPGADDYDQWKIGELRAEVDDRNKITGEREGVTLVQVIGTGVDGKITKADLIKGLRLWDDENPGVLES